ncbi:MAG: hypothetical protein Crog4KO_24190 [Crocinitomicaceae bacterium]
MKQRKTVRNTLISTLLIVGLFIFCYYWFIRPIYKNNLDQQRIISIKKEQTIRFGKYPDQESVFGIELEITGQANSNLDIIISDQKGDKHVASVKGKNLDFTYKNDWYKDSCFITIIPRENAGGKAEINCRFLAR